MKKSQRPWKFRDDFLEEEHALNLKTPPPPTTNKKTPKQKIKTVGALCSVDQNSENYEKSNAQHKTA